MLKWPQWAPKSKCHSLTHLWQCEVTNVIGTFFQFLVNHRGPKWQFNTVKSSVIASALRTVVTVQGRKIFQCPRTILRTIPIVTFAYHFLWSQQCHNNREGLYLFQKEILFAVLGFQPQDRVVRQRAWARACTGAIFSLGAVFISHSLA